MSVRALLLFLLLAPAVQAQDAADPLQAALAQARERRVPVLVDLTAPWCYSCYYMTSHVLNGPEWERAHREAVVLELDVDSPPGARVMQAWGVKAMPTYLLIAGDGQELGRILGEQSRADFYRWLFGTIGRDSLEALKAKVVDAQEASVAAAREVLRAYHARYDTAGGLGWFLAQPPPVRGALARDAVSASWIARLELQRSLAEKDMPACLNVAPMALAGSLGCERPYEVAKVLACSSGQPEPVRRELLKPQAELMQLLVEKRVFSEYRCADERSVITTTADLHHALGDPSAEALVLERAIADLKARIGGDLRKDRNLVDNLRVYLERAGRAEELDALLVKLIAAYPGDYVYAYRYGKVLAARGRHADAVPFFEQAAAKAYGVNKLRLAELHARSLQALGRNDDARQLLGDVLRDNGPWFPEDAAKLKALREALPPPAPAAAS